MMPVITSCVKNYWRNVHKQWCQRMDPEKCKKLMDTMKFQSHRATVRFPTVLCLAVIMLMREIRQRSTKQRHSAIEHCMSKNIPTNEGVGIVDTNFASEPCSNISDLDS